MAYFAKLGVRIPKWDKIVLKDLVYSEIEAIWPFEAFLIDFWLLKVDPSKVQICNIANFCKCISGRFRLSFGHFRYFLCIVLQIDV